MGRPTLRRALGDEVQSRRGTVYTEAAPMTSPPRPDDESFELSPPTRNEIALAIAAYLSQRSTDGDGHLRHAAVRVATEANQLGVSADQMLAAVKRLFERAPRISGDVQKRVEASNKFARWCVEYYTASHDDAK
jgi:hypothetical protein